MTNHPNHAAATQDLQRYLRQLSYGEPTIPPPPIDGIFDTRTTDALRRFQQLKGLAETGIADALTWELLYVDYRASLAANSPPRTVAVFPPDPLGYVLTVGSVGFPVTVLQYMLRELQHSYSELSDVAQTGIYDEQTANAVRVVQKGSFLPMTGVVDLLTWNSITDAYNTLFTRVSDE